MTRIVVAYRIDEALARDLARGSGELPLATTSGIIDCDASVDVSWESDRKRLRLDGPRIRHTIEAVDSFSVRIEP